MTPSMLESLTIGDDMFYSPLALDTDLAEIVAMFVDELPDRVEALREALRSGDREQLGRAAHQLKGSAGSYGFPQITPFAARLEYGARANEAEAALLQMLNELAATCSKAQAGKPAR